MAEDKQAEPKGRSVEGAAFFSLLLPADAQENLFWWSDFLREASGLIATIHWLELFISEGLSQRPRRLLPNYQQETDCDTKKKKHNATKLERQHYVLFEERTTARV